jgi:ATP-dependent Lon protease
MSRKRSAESSGKASANPTPALTPVLPLRDLVHFPGVSATVHVAREPSVRAVRKAIQGDHRILVLSQRDMSIEDVGPTDLYRIGTLSEVLQTMPMPDGSMRVAIRGLCRAAAADVLMVDGAFAAESSVIEEEFDYGLEVEAAMRMASETYHSVVERNRAIPPESIESVSLAPTPGQMADAIAHHLPLKPSEKQELLETIPPAERLEAVLRFLKKEEQLLALNSKIQMKVEKELGDAQREYFLREQLKAIQQELSEHAEEDEAEEYRRRIEASGMPSEALHKALREVDRLSRTPSSSPEGVVMRNYLDLLVSLPWNQETQDSIDIAAAEKILDEKHFGLKEAKERILDLLAVRQLRGKPQGQVLCFLGPPGVGKTSIARSIASAMGRKFVRIALGGVRDEAEVRGHRRTYVGAMPGRIIQGLQAVGSRNPVILLDEIDKLAHDGQGDPVSALLEVLDPEQNPKFVDHYVDAPFDLGSVIFIATANSAHRIPSPLLDRMEIIEFPTYTEGERLKIAERHLIPKSIADHGLDPSQLSFRSSAVAHIVRHYAPEAGVRQLERLIAQVCRKAARAIAEGQVLSMDVGPALLMQYLGRPPYDRHQDLAEGEVGAINSMVVGEFGGAIMTVEVCQMPPLGTEPTLKLTGNMGGIMRESAEAALTCVRSVLPRFGLADGFRADLHVHVPEGAIPKDGPSAGLAIALAMLSAVSGRPIRPRFAVTGEITLRGKVLGVGGVRDKLLAAYRANCREVLIPWENHLDVEDLDPEVRAGMGIHAVKDFGEAIRHALLEPES